MEEKNDSITVISIDSPAQLPAVAETVIERIGDRRIIAFRGGMGEGKTTLIGEIMLALGSDDTATSPTFALVNEYHTADGEPVYHFDFYRIDRLEEVFDMGYEEYFYSGHLCLVEWPEKIEPLLPEDVMTVRITIDSDTGRTFEID